MTKAAFFCSSDESIDTVYAMGRRERVADRCDLYPVTITAENIDEHLAGLQDLEVVFSTWGMFLPSDEHLEAMPNLKAVFYAAGSVQHFAPAFHSRGISVFSAWGANAVPVAEFTLAQILLANKGYFRNIRDCKVTPRKGNMGHRGPGNFGECVAVLGAGMAGRALIKLLEPFELDVIVHDPFLPDEDAGALGVEKVSLEDAFRRGLVVTNHIANLPATVGMLKREHFEVMREFAVFINTGRGATVDEEQMIGVLQEREDLTALLDVTEAEPPQRDSPLYTMPNVSLTGHIAGSLGNEVVRMADFMIEEFLAWGEGRPLRYEVTSEMLKTLA
jgi:phosphoglycerate dehydrogenase-like enzyme